jgi:hypothetical protein
MALVKVIKVGLNYGQLMANHLATAPSGMFADRAQRSGPTGCGVGA